MKRGRVYILAIALSLVSAAAFASTTSSKGLEGLSADEVRAELGEPDVSQQAGAGALWTYRFETCALMVAFHAATGQMRVFQVMSGARRRGETPPSAQQCLAVGRDQHAGHKTSDPIGDRLR
jgi:hypothetical protein